MTERMKALFTIVNRGDGWALAKLYEQNGVTLHLQMAASGTASSEILNMLGLSGREKDLLLMHCAGKRGRRASGKAKRRSGAAF